MFSWNEYYGGVVPVSGVYSWEQSISDIVLWSKQWVCGRSQSCKVTKSLRHSIVELRCMCQASRRWSVSQQSSPSLCLDQRSPPLLDVNVNPQSAVRVNNWIAFIAWRRNNYNLMWLLIYGTVSTWGLKPWCANIWYGDGMGHTIGHWC